jgi:hypothetical protein
MQRRHRRSRRRRLRRLIADSYADSDLISKVSRESWPGVLEILMSKLPIARISGEARKHVQKLRARFAKELMTRDVITVREKMPSVRPTERVSLSPYWRLFFAVGVVGGYTTFSTFEYESIRLLQDGEMLLGAVYLLGSVLTGGLAAIAGIALGSSV